MQRRFGTELGFFIVLFLGCFVLYVNGEEGNTGFGGIGCGPDLVLNVGPGP